MNHIMKKTFALFLAVVMLISMTPAFAKTVVPGNTEETIYFALDFYDEDAASKVTEVSEGDWFTILINFFGNPSELENSLHGYQLIIGYDADKIALDSSFEKVLNEPLQYVPALSNGIALIQGLVPNGLVKKGSVINEGTLCYLYAEAKTDLTLNDLEAVI